MATRMENISGLFSNVRTRNIIIITGVVLGLTVFVGLYGLLKNSGTTVTSGASVGQPPKLESTPEFTQSVTAEQENLVKQTNQQLINNAKQSGGSAITSAIGGAGGDINSANGMEEEAADTSVNDTEANQASTKNKDNYAEYVNKLLNSETKQNATVADANLKSNVDQKSSQADAQQLAQLKRMQDQQKTLDEQQQAQAYKMEQDAVADLRQSMESQAKAIFEGWVGPGAAPQQVYVETEFEKGLEGAPSTSETQGSVGAPTSNTSPPPPAAKSPPVIKAGDVLFAILTTAVNSDEPGPVMATIVSGKYKGAKLVGGLQPMNQITGTNGPEAVTLTFNTMNIPSVPNSVSINAVAIDSETARTALASDVDHHYVYRYGLTFAASFLEGYGNAITQSGSVTTNAFNGTQTTFQQTLTPKQEILAALGQVGTNLSSQLSDALSRPNTITVDSGVSLGILFLSDVTVQM